MNKRQMDLSQVINTSRDKDIRDSKVYDYEIHNNYEIRTQLLKGVEI